MAAAMMAAPAAANDSTAETGAGGLVLTRSDAIDMVSEDLFVSAEQVRVRYVFRNRAQKDVKVTVAFPMPDRDLGPEQFQDVAFPAGFETKVEGAPVHMRVERKATVKGRDVSATLAGLRVPISGDALGKALDGLPERERQRLEQAGIAGIDEYDDDASGMKKHLFPLWTVKETWYWDQLFPAGRDLRVEHQYRPGTGGSVGTDLASAELRRSAEGRAKIALYCVDSDFLAGLDRLARASGGGDFPVMPEQRIGYILTTGGNWRSPIGDFRLVVDKGAPANLVSFCGSGVRKISPTRFEVRRKNWRPDRDLHILIVRPANGE
jgi:hypothetical protein